MNGMIAACVTWGSLPSATQARVIVTCSRDHLSYDIICRTKTFVLHLLNKDQSPLVHRFGLQSGKTIDKFDAAFVRDHVEGGDMLQSARNDGGVAANNDNINNNRPIPVVKGAVGVLVCNVVTELLFPDSVIFVAEIVNERHTLNVDQMLQQVAAWRQRDMNELPQVLTRHRFALDQPEMAAQHVLQLKHDTETHHAAINDNSS